MLKTHILMKNIYKLNLDVSAFSFYPFYYIQILADSLRTSDKIDGWYIQLSFWYLAVLLKNQ